MSKNTKFKLNEHYSEKSNEDLMNLYQTGDYSAFEVLYQRTSGRIYQYLKKRVSSEIAQELLQEIFIKLHKARGQYSQKYPFIPWLFTISRNTLIDYYKSARLVSPISNSNQTDILSINNDFQTNEINISTTLNLLPENQRQAIELRYLNDWSFEKIADIIKTSPVNVRQLISRGLKRLRQLSLKKGRAN